MPEQKRGIRITKQGLGLDEANMDVASMTVTVVEDANGSPLSGYIERLGGYTGMVTDPFGQERPVSLEQWRHADPTKVRVRIELHYQPIRKK